MGIEPATQGLENEGEQCQEGTLTFSVDISMTWCEHAALMLYVDLGLKLGLTWPKLNNNGINSTPSSYSGIKRLKDVYDFLKNETPVGQHLTYGSVCDGYQVSRSL